MPENERERERKVERKRESQREKEDAEVKEKRVPGESRHAEILKRTKSLTPEPLFGPCVKTPYTTVGKI